MDLNSIVRWYYLDDDNQPVRASVEDASLKSEGKRDVDKTVVGCALVSTVFLILDHGRFGGGSPPILFETMVFNHPAGIEFMSRYTTYDAAQAGHEETVNRLCDSIWMMQHGQTWRRVKKRLNKKWIDVDGFITQKEMRQFYSKRRHYITNPKP